MKEEELIKSLKEQLEMVIKENQRLLEKHFEQDKKILTMNSENSDYKKKIEKALAYIGLDEDLLKTCEIYDVNGIEVYKILQGVSNDNSNE